MLGSFLTKPRAKAMEIEVVSSEPIAAIPSQYKVFSSGSHWQLYKVDNKYCYTITSQNRRSDFISRLAVFPNSFSSGKIHTYSPVGDRDFPLAYPLDQLALIHLSSLHQGLLAHACGIIFKGKGLLFAGSSGAGKSTIGALFQKYRDCVILSDDRSMVKKENNGYYLYGTPWRGTLDSCSPERAPLTRVFFLKKAKRNYLRRLNSQEASKRLVSASFLPYWDEASMVKSLAVISSLVRKDVFYELSFAPGKAAVEILNNEL